MITTATSIKMYERMKLSNKQSKENKERIEIDFKAKRELRFSLPQNVFRLVRTCETANKI